MGLRDILKKYKLDSPTTNERIDLMIDALKKKPGYEERLRAYGKQSGGGDSGDFIGPQLTSFVESAQNDPEQFRAMLGSLFSLVFVVNRIEHLPAIGSILGASLDLMLMGGKMMTRAIQSSLPPLVGLLPLPYASTAGLVMSAVFGMIAWPMISLVSLSRQDFASATEAYARAIPPPFGEILAGTFTEGNKAVAKINEKRVQLGEDLSVAFTQISEMIKGDSESTQEGLKALASKTAEAARTTAKSGYDRFTQPTGGFHRRTKRKAWRTPRTRRRFARR
jgi:hypothetical protein